MSHRTIKITGCIDVFDTDKERSLLSESNESVLVNVINVVEKSYEELGIVIEEAGTQEQEKRLYTYHYYAEVYSTRNAHKPNKYVDGIIELDYPIKNNHNYMGIKMAVANAASEHFGGTYNCCTIMNLTLLNISST